ncbi:hypothetical protein, partial [Nocardiopsis sp. CNR-923]|uniref:hypothetical protein n=1 Tax=Nocardiopsis sp. CNR-923 TaxID=1904965 RepID=UPI0021CC8D93
ERSPRAHRATHHSQHVIMPGAGPPRTAFEMSSKSAEINIVGFSYQDIQSDSPIKERLSWLKRANPSFNPHPYAQLSRWCLERGDDAEHRIVEMEAIRRFYGSGGPLFRVWGFLQDKAIGFGFKPHRAIALFSLIWISGSAWFAFIARGCSGTSYQVCPVKADEHPAWDPMLYSLDVLIPLLDLGHGVSWDLRFVKGGFLYFDNKWLDSCDHNHCCLWSFF